MEVWRIYVSMRCQVNGAVEWHMQVRPLRSNSGVSDTERGIPGVVDTVSSVRRQLHQSFYFSR